MVSSGQQLTDVWAEHKDALTIMMASRAGDRTAEDLRQHSSIAASGATDDEASQNDIAGFLRETDPRTRSPSTYLSANHAPRSLRMERKSSHRKRSSQKRRSPTEEEVPYTPADRLAAQMMGIPLHKLDRSGRPVTCAFVSRYDSESDSSGSEEDWKMYAKRFRRRLRRRSMERPAHHPKDVRSPAAEGIGDRDADERQGDCVGSCQTDLDCRGVRPRDAEERPGDCVGN